ncbi:hypothetical protein [Edaphocola aurantiacus]|uniref:hypothetical protein n=1 Tax=Edaphocola aurantiacus TaxID=2601682 RepID=UPI001C95433A|nr:hypothetical protein [Edaphocola aurantiacus]
MMHYIHQLLTATVICVLSLSMSSCSFLQAQIPDNKYTITSEKLDAIISNNDTNVIVLYATWCDGAKETIDQFYKEAQDSINNKKLHKKIVLLLADDKVDTAVLERHRSWGMESYYIPSSGTSAIEHRSSIKQFINQCFPKNKIEWLGMGFKVPAEIIVAPNKVILNKKDDMQATRFVIERILGFPVGKIEVVNAK